MRPSKSLIVKHTLSMIDLKVLFLAEEWHGEHLGVVTVAAALEEGELKAFNSIRKLCKARLIAPAPTPSQLGPITRTGRLVLAEEASSVE